MMRELAALMKLSHRNICTLKLVNLHDFSLHLLFPYVEKTLHDILNPMGEPTIANHHLTSTFHLEKDEILNIMSQVTCAMAYCHGRGILHRNLKPKHLLVIPGAGPRPLATATVKVADFALVRILS